MRKAIAIIVLILLGALLFWYTGSKMSENAQNKPPSEFEALMGYDFKNEYPSTIDEVMVVYNEMMEYTYGPKDDLDLESFYAEQLPKIIQLQRKLYDDELLLYNPYEVQYEKLKKELEDYDMKEIYIIDSKIMHPEYLPSKDEEDREMAKVRVVYYTTVSQNIYMEFGLRKTDEAWKIVGFKQIEMFKIAEE